MALVTAMIQSIIIIIIITIIMIIFIYMAQIQLYNFQMRLTYMSYIYLLHITCGYQCDKAVTKNDTRVMI